MSDPRGWTGDKDNFPEPLIWAATSTGDPVPPPMPPPPPPPPPTPEPPVVTFINPTEGSVISSKTFIHVEATDADGILAVQVFIDGKKFKQPDSTEAYSWLWQTKSKKDGQHTISAIACDIKGNCTTESVTFTVSNPKGNK